MAGLPEIRTIVDWNKDSFFEPVDGQTLPNLIPTAISLIDLDLTGVSAATFTHEAETSLYGLRYQRVVTGTGVFAGLAYGSTSGAVIDDIPVTPATSYRATAWVRGVSGSYGATPIIFQAYNETPTYQNGTGNITLTASWQKVTFTMTTTAGTDFLRLWFIKNNSANNITFDITGLMLTAGTTAVNYYNAGADYSAYEDVSADVMMAQWDSRMNRETFIPDEGQLTLTLKNTERKYSPRYTGSPLYGAMVHGLRVRVEIKRVNGTYVQVWAGWVTGYDIHPMGTRGDFQTILTATQGLFNLDAVSLIDNVQENVGIQDVIDGVLTSGWYPPTTPYVTVLGTSRLDETAWMPDYANFRTADAGITEFPLVGDNWTDGETKGSTVLKDMLEVERGWMFFNRAGQLIFKNREAFLIGTAADATISLDDDANRATYVFSPIEVNSVTATYYPSGTEANQILWQTRGTKRCGPRRDRRVDAKFKYEEGEKITVISINDFGTGGNDSTITGVDETGNVIDPRDFFAIAELRNGKGIITIFNQASVTGYFTILLKGTIETNADSEELTRNTDDTTQELRHESIDNRLLKNDVMATDLADYVISFYGQDFDEFTDMTIEARDTDWLDRMLDLEAGMLVSLTEYQTGVEDKKQVIVGESSTWTPGHLTTTFQLARIDETAYWILGTSALSQTTILGY